jgi:hypothetical protein
MNNVGINCYIAAKAENQISYYNAAENRRIFNFYIKGFPGLWTSMKEECLNRAVFLAKRAGKSNIKQNFKKLYGEIRKDYLKLPF